MIHSSHRIAVAAVLIAAWTTQSGAQGPPIEFWRPQQTTIVGPMEVALDLVGGRAEVQVMINGHGPYRFGVETGSPYIVIDASLAETLALPHPDRAPGPNSRRIDSMSFGGVMLRQTNVFVGTRIPPELGFDGLLGLPAYHDLLLTIDYPAKRLHLEQGTLPPADNITLFDIVPLGPFLGLVVDFAGSKVPAVIDTQGGAFISCGPSASSNFPWLAAPVASRSESIGAVSGIEVKHGQLGGDTHLGRFVVRQPGIDVVQPPPGYPGQCLLGYEFLEAFAMTLDQQTHRVRFARTDSTIPEPPARK